MLNRRWWKREVHLIPPRIKKRYAVGFLVAVTTIAASGLLWLWLPLVFHGHAVRWYEWAEPAGCTVFWGVFETQTWYRFIQQQKQRQLIRRRWGRCCVHCGYSLHGIRSPLCPECGKDCRALARGDVRLVALP